MPRQDVVLSHTAARDVGQTGHSRTNEGCSPNRPSASNREMRERGGDSKYRKGELFYAAVVPNELSPQLHGESS